jgi:ABC-type multidrug transport system fused ATPase/permease subunit
MLNKYNEWLLRVRNLGLSNRIIITLLSISILTTVTEMFGIGILLPIFQFVKANGDISILSNDEGVWVYVVNFFNFFELQPTLVYLLAIGFSLFLLKQIFSYINTVYSFSISQKIMQDIRNRIFSSYIYANSSYHDGMLIGNLANIMVTEVNSAVRGSMVPVELAIYIIMLLGYTSLLFFISWEATVVSVIILLIASIFPQAWIKSTRKIGRKLVNSNTLLSEFLIHRMQSPKLVRLSGTEVAEINNFAGLIGVQKKHAIHIAILKARVEVVMEPVVIGIIMAFLYVSSTILLLPIEIIGIYLLIMMRLLPIVKGVISKWQTVQRYLGSIEVVENSLSEMKQSTEIDTGDISLTNVNNICFNNVSYSYKLSNYKTLNNISINIKANTTVAIVGPSGGGKSTLVDLLPRIRVPDYGTLSINNININKYTVSSLRRCISYVPQTPQIFDGTIKQHILYGKPKATYEEIIRASQMSGADEFIDILPNGYDTYVSEGATNLSGGQRQRLDLARALVKKSPILILDEPTSNLDAHSEKAFIRTLKGINSNNMTVIIISHRLHSILHSDQIIVLNNGSIEGIGTHKDLKVSNSWYSDAWKLQGEI